MNQVTIKSEDPILINAITFWFENGEAQNDFLESRYGQVWIEHQRENGLLTTIEQYPSIDYQGDNDYGVEHTITLDE